MEVYGQQTSSSLAARLGNIPLHGKSLHIERGSYGSML